LSRTSLRSLKPSFVLRFIRADLLSSWQRFAFVIVAFALGVAILVAVSGFSAGVRSSIETEAKSLLAADISVSSSQNLQVQAFAGVSANARFSQEITFASMLGVPGNSRAARLVQVRGIEGDYPFYGTPKIDPQASLEAVRSQQIRESVGEPPGALVDAILAQQFALKLGDLINLGSTQFRVLGIIQSFPGESYARTVIAPKVFVPLRSLSETGLLQRGSRVTYKRYYAFESDQDLKSSLKALETNQPNFHFEIGTVASRKENIERVLNNVSRYLILVSLVALILGALGVASAMYTYIRSRLAIVAAMRCIGATSGQVLLLYLGQGAILAVIGTVSGAIIGITVQYLLPLVLGEFIPLPVEFEVSFDSMIEGVLAGLLTSAFFCVVPLLSVVSISPLHAIREGASGQLSTKTSRHFSLKVGVVGVLLLCAITTALARSIPHGLAFSGGLLVLVVILWVVSFGTSRLIKSLRPRGGSFGLRYGMASLHRPQNQTTTLVLTLGLATFLLAVIYLSRTILLTQLTVAGSGIRPNLVLFDVQEDQRDEVRALTTTNGLTIAQEVPIVTMRLVSINGVDNLALRADSEIPQWTLRREYRSSYRDSLIESENVISGELIPKFSGNIQSDAVPVSVEEGIAKNLKLKINDGVVFDVQGLQIRTVIKSIRRVDWRRIQTNFFFLFPQGVLESAPQFYAIMTHSPSISATVNLQQGLLEKFGNVSAIDLNLILETADQIFAKIATAIKFLAAITALSGLLVLSGAIATTRSTRVREFLLLRTVGATRSQLVAATIVEFMLLALCSCIVGLGAGIAAAWGLSAFYFAIPFSPPLIPLLSIATGVTLLVLIIGTSSTIGLLRTNAVEVLRGEG